MYHYNMKKFPIFRVVKHTYFEKCNVKREQFTIEFKKKILWWERWVSVKEVNYCGWSDCYKSEIIFQTESEAIFAIKNLQNGYIPDGWTKEISSVLDLNR